MRNIFLLCSFLIFSVSALAQEVVIDTNYYAPPPVRRRVLTADPDQRTGPSASKRSRPENEWINQFNEVQTWYVALEGGFRTDGSVLTNSFNGLVSNPGQTNGTYGVLLGYVYRNGWGAEVGVTRAPVHLNLTIVNTPQPYVFKYQNSGYGIPLRLKRRIGSGSRAEKGTGFWVSAGAWLVPNGSAQIDPLHFTGHTAYSRRAPIDTLQLGINTETANRITGLAELGIDYTVRLSSFFELGFHARKYWGLGDALRSNLVYTVNSAAETKSTITANGSGWGFGMVLRYIYGRQHELKKQKTGS